MGAHTIDALMLSLFKDASMVAAPVQIVIMLVCASAAALLWAMHSSVGLSRTVPLLPGARPLIGHAMEVLQNLPRIHHWLLEQTRAMGYRTYSFWVPTLPTFFMVTDPACLEYMLKTKNDSFVKGKIFYTNFEPLLGHGIFTSDGQQWLWQRKLASHVFNVRSFKQYINIVFAEKMQLLTQLLSSAAGSGVAVDLHDLMYRFTLDSFGQIGFGTNIGSLTCEGKVPFAAAFDDAQVIVNARFWIPAWPLVELFTGDRFRMSRDSQAVKQFALGIVNTRRQQLAAATAAAAADPSSATPAGDSSDGAPCDLLSLFMEAQGPDGKPLNDKQLVDTVLNFIIAGRDTTAQALSWTFYELLRHPEAQAKLLAEIRAVLGPGLKQAAADGSAVRPSYDEIRQLRYTRACFLEALRLHPSVPQDVRYAAEQDTLPDGSVIPKGGQVIYSPYVVNRMESFWGADADSFRPGRWLEMESMPSPYSHLTFNAGPRLCLGQRLAEIEGVYVLAGLLARFRFEQAVPGERVNYTVASTMPMKEGLQVLVEVRK